MPPQHYRCDASGSLRNVLVVALVPSHAFGAPNERIAEDPLFQT
jgi:hypothetical protein